MTKNLDQETLFTKRFFQLFWVKRFYFNDISTKVNNDKQLAP